MELARGDELIQGHTGNSVEVPAQDGIASLTSALAGLDQGVDLCQHDGQLGQLHVAPPGVEQQVSVGHADA